MMTVNTTTHKSPTPRCLRNDPGEGYRLVEPGERIKQGDQVYCGPYGWNGYSNVKAGQSQKASWRPRRRKLPTTEELYQELLYAVARVFPGETRHQTALRYIREAESGADYLSACCENKNP